LSNVFYVHLKSRFSPELIAKLVSSANALGNLHLTEEEKSLVNQGYMDGLHAVFASFAVLVAIHLGMCLCIKDYGLKHNCPPQMQRQT
jgi:hypothetical protein